jgi:hypothetical protein
MIETLTRKASGNEPFTAEDGDVIDFLFDRGKFAFLSFGLSQPFDRADAELMFARVDSRSDSAQKKEILSDRGV